LSTADRARRLTLEVIRGIPGRNPAAVFNLVELKSAERGGMDHAESAGVLLTIGDVDS
jgi:hypothetical protein